MTEQRRRQLRRRLQEARYRLMERNEEFAEPLYGMTFVATERVQRISTNGETIFFDPDWMAKLELVSLDFALSHQLMHVRLHHIERSAFFKGDRYHLACDIIANAKLRGLGWTYDKLPGIGTIYHETFYPAEDGCRLKPEEAFVQIPFDPADMSPGKRRKYMIDSEEWWDSDGTISAEETIILSPKDDDPDDLGCERYPKPGKKIPYKRNIQFGSPVPVQVDGADSDVEPAVVPTPAAWEDSINELLEVLRERRERSTQVSNRYISDERYWEKQEAARLDWRTLLNHFLQEAISDYSFSPPDRRFADSPFFLPDFNETDCVEKQIWFLVDTSGSVNDRTLSTVYSEICGAIEQFDGLLQGVLVFFDMKTYQPISFESVEDLLRVTPKGGGGTDYRCVFELLRKNDCAGKASSVVIITDGEADFSKVDEIEGLPLLWVLTKQGAEVPFGKTAYI